jgi:hypothetical protein
MNELFITLMLFIPTADQGKIWSMGEVQNQIQVTFESGVMASYSAAQVPCHTVRLKDGFTLYKTKSMGQEVCYLADTRQPDFVRSPWTPAITKTFNPHKQQECEQ